MKKIVIIGGGFAGMNFINKLANQRDFAVTLVDRNNYYFFPPLIYQLATGFLETANISYPFRKLLRKKKNVQFRMGELIRIDLVNRICHLNNGTLPYDELVFATGAKTNYFGNKNIEKNAIPMKTVNDALQMRNILLQNLEQACIIDDEAEKKKLLTIVVAGGGPTGVEVAGMLAELRRNIAPKDYPELHGSNENIYIIDGGQSLLAAMSEKSHQESYKALEKLGVHIKLNTTVIDYRMDEILLSNGEVILSKNLIWTAGVTANVFDGIPPSAIGRGNRMITDVYNKVQGTDNIYAIGDISIQQGSVEYPMGHPQLAQVAIQQGQNLANNFVAKYKNRALKAFKYKDKGSAAIVGSETAVVDLPKNKLHLGGYPALMAWLFIHVIQLIHFRSKIMTLYNWAIAYFTKDQSLRLIIRPAKKND